MLALAAVIMLGVDFPVWVLWGHPCLKMLTHGLLGSPINSLFLQGELLLIKELGLRKRG